MDLDEWRHRIDEIDGQILRLLDQRAALAVEIGRVKRERGASVHVPERKHEILAELTRRNEGPMPPAAVRAIWTEILSVSRHLQQPLQVAYLGPEATFSHQAALRHFGQLAGYVAVRGIPEVFEAVERGRAGVGVVPIENSTEGSVTHTLDGLSETGLLICGEVLLEIHHFLLGRARDLAEVKRVYSHPQALAQCRRWLDRHLSDAEPVEVGSTAAAVEHALSDPGAAAVASEMAGQLHGLPVLQARIEDYGHNVTRFLVLGTHAAGATGHDKTSVLLSVPHRVGALHRAIEPFATGRLNLTKIESRPTRRRPWEYVFFVDIEGHQSDDAVAEVLDAVRERCLFVKVLGSYPAAL